MGSCQGVSGATSNQWGFAMQSSVTTRFLGASQPLQLAVLIAALLAPAAAVAQVAPYTLNIRDQVYEPLQNPIDTGSSGDDVGGTITLPFEVEFYGHRYNQVGYSSNGYLVFTTHSRTIYSNVSLPNAADPDGIVAVWWDDSSCPAGGLRYEILGTEPTRMFVFEWACYGLGSNTNTWEAQAWLFENSSTVEVRYGTINPGTRAWTVTVGIEDEVGAEGVRAFPCSEFGNCTPTVWPTNQAIVYSQGPDLEVTRLTVQPIGWAGVPLPLEAIMRNNGGKEAIGARARFWLSADAQLDRETDLEIGVSPDVHDLAPFATAAFRLEAPVPEVATPGVWYILVEADPFDAVEEGVEGNNVFVHHPFVVGEPTPDLSIAWSLFPDVAAPGDRIQVEWAARNGGNEPVQNATYGIFLSTNSSITGSDFPLHTGLVNVGPLSEEPVVTEVDLPADFAPGPYWIGVIIDPELSVPEIDEFNNGSVPHPIDLSSGLLEVLTTALPDGEIGSPWCQALQARGGDGIYIWSLESGTLPDGLAFETETVGGRPVSTRLCGRLERLGTYGFTLRVESAGLSALTDYTVTVVEPGVALTVATPGLPDGTVLEPYEAWLAAVGGRIPYEWTLAGGALPEGMRLESNGRLHGTPKFDGVYTFVARVRDASAQSKQVELDLVIGPPQTLRCLSRSLPTAMLGEGYDVQLRASGGTPPLEWRTLESRRLPSGEDQGETWVGLPPPSLSLSLDGRVSGTVNKAGRYQWIVEVVGQEGGAGDRCAVEFEVGYESGITITTRHLAAAYAGSPYEVELAVVGGTAPWTWSLQSGSELPPGLELTADGTLRGVLGEELLEGAASRRFDFSVVVRDVNNREAKAPFALTLLREERPVWTDPGIPKPREVGGCQAGGGAGAVALLAVLGLISRRRRR